MIIIKKITYLYFTLLSLSVLIGYTLNVSAEELNETKYNISSSLFPDDNFRALVSSRFDTDSDGILTSQEIEAVTTISCYSEKIASMSGCEIFENVETINCQWNELESLNIGNLKKLKVLICNNNALTELDVSNNLLLEEIACGNNEIERIVFGENNKLQVLNCSSNHLKNMDLSDCTDLKKIICGYNEIDAIELSTCKELEEINLTSNALNSLNLSQCVKLHSLICALNENLNSVVLEQHPNLETVILNGNCLTDIYLEQCPSLKELILNGNKVVELNLNGLSNLIEVSCSQNELKSISLNGCNKLSKIDCWGNNIKKLDFSECPSVVNIICYQNAIEKLILTGCVSLETLWCNSNQISELILNDCVKMKDLRCSYNEIQQLKLESLANLEYLDCSKNELVCLDISSNKALQYFTCYDNERKVGTRNYQLGDDFEINRVYGISGGTINRGIVHVDISGKECTYSYRVDGVVGGKKADFKVIYDRNGFDLTKDGWPIPNLNIGFGYPEEYYFSEQRYREVFGRGNQYNQTEWKWKGACFGMAMVAVLFSENPQIRQQYIGNKDLTEIGVLANYSYKGEEGKCYSIRENAELIKLVEQYQIWQNSVTYQEYTNRNYNLLDIVEDVRENQATYMVCVTYCDSLFAEAKHAVVINSSVCPQKENRWWKLSIYDPTNPYYSGSTSGVGLIQRYSKATELYLYISEDGKKWKMPMAQGCSNPFWIVYNTDTWEKNKVGKELIFVRYDEIPQKAEMEVVEYGWVTDADRFSFWYENGIRQGILTDPKGVLGDGIVRGREICDMGTQAWYWLDACYDGAKACNKEVWMPYIYQDEVGWDETAIWNAANLSGTMAHQVYDSIKNRTGKWVRYDENGKMYKGWYTVPTDSDIYPSQRGNTYYYDQQTGLMAKGWTVINGKDCFFDEITGVYNALRVK